MITVLVQGEVMHLINITIYTLILINPCYSALAATLSEKLKTGANRTGIENTAIFMAEVYGCITAYPEYNQQLQPYIVNIKNHPKYKEFERSAYFNSTQLKNEVADLIKENHPNGFTKNDCNGILHYLQNQKL